MDETSKKTYSALVASGSQSGADTLMSLLPKDMFYPVTPVRSAALARRHMSAEGADAVFINSPLPDDARRLAAELVNTTEAGVLLLCRDDYAEAFTELSPKGVLVLQKPLDGAMIRAAAGLLVSTRERLRGTRTVADSIDDRIEEVKLVERAKLLLMNYLQMTEAQAHRYIVRQAMDLRISRREAAMNVIKTYLN